MLMEKSGLTDYEEAKELILRYGNVKKAMDALSNG
jgi:N-acetylmuramic acid 6-phosphate etherase